MITNRRGFFAALLGVVVAPQLPARLPPGRIRTITHKVSAKGAHPFVNPFGVPVTTSWYDMWVSCDSETPNLEWWYTRWAEGPTSRIPRRR